MPPPDGLKTVTSDPMPDISPSPLATLPSSVESQPVSGIPRARARTSGEISLAARGETHAEAALAASAHAEANFAALVRAIQHVATTLQGAAEARADVREEVGSLRSLLVFADEEQRILEQRVAILEQALDRAEREIDRERSFLFEETDAFIARLCDEHESVVLELERRLSEAAANLSLAREDADARNLVNHTETRNVEELERRLRRAEAETERVGEERDAAQRSILRLELQRDEAQAASVRAARERDQLRSELLNSRSGPTNSRGIAYRDTLRDTNSRRTPPGGIAVATPYHETPKVSASLRPEKVSNNAVPSEPSSHPDSSKPSLRQKPDVSTRPLVGYSLAGDAVPEEQTAPRSSRNPER